MWEQLEFQFECERGAIGVAGAQLEFQLEDFVRIPWSGIVRMLNAQIEQREHMDRSGSDIRESNISTRNFVENPMGLTLQL